MAVDQISVSVLHPNHCFMYKIPQFYRKADFTCKQLAHWLIVFKKEKKTWLNCLQYTSSHLLRVCSEQWIQKAYWMFFRGGISWGSSCFKWTVDNLTAENIKMTLFCHRKKQFVTTAIFPEIDMDFETDTVTPVTMKFILAEEKGPSRTIPAGKEGRNAGRREIESSRRKNSKIKPSRKKKKKPISIVLKILTCTWMKHWDIIFPQQVQMHFFFYLPGEMIFHEKIWMWWRRSQV